MNFLRRHARFIVPIPYILLAALKGWEGISKGDKTQILACLGFLGAAFLFYVGQKHVHQERQRRLSSGSGLDQMGIPRAKEKDN